MFMVFFLPYLCINIIFHQFGLCLSASSCISNTVHSLIILYFDDFMKQQIHISSLPCISATSTGNLQGLDNTNGGVCRTKSMKLVLRVGQSKFFVLVCVCVCGTMRVNCLSNHVKNKINCVILIIILQQDYLLSGFAKWSDHCNQLFILLKRDHSYEWSQHPNSNLWQLNVFGFGSLYIFCIKIRNAISWWSFFSIILCSYDLH